MKSVLHTHRISQGNSFFFRLFFCFCLLLPMALIGCSPKVAVHEPIVKPAYTLNPEHPSGFTAADIPENCLTEVETNILVTPGEIDSCLTKEQMIEVSYYFQFFLKERKEMLGSFLGRSLPYIEYTKEVFKERNMPESLAYLAYLESGYNVKAKSSAGATGLWQFMPATGNRFGLKQDWWGDWRLDPYLATHAAADYLTYLYSLFKDWPLAISAYNAGEGKIKRALDGTNTQTLHDLILSNQILDEKARLRTETLEYIPRYVALCKIMQNSTDLGITPLLREENPYSEVFSTLIDRNTDLLALAHALDMDWQEFKIYNPALNRHVSPGDRIISIYVPYHKKDMLLTTLSEKHDPKGWFTYTLKKGDTYSSISKLTNVPVSVLKAANNLKEPLLAGTPFFIPTTPNAKPFPAQITNPTYVASTPKVSQTAKSTPPTVANQQKSSNKASSYTVKSGDTLYSIAQKYNISVEELTKANNNINAKSLQVGKNLNIPQEKNLVLIAQNTNKHVVESGDTVWAIARKYNVPPADIMKINDFPENPLLKPGNIVLIP